MVERLKLAAKCLVILIWTFRYFGMTFDLRFDRRTDICEPIKIPMCQDMPYNMTRMPNLLHHSTQENAELAIDQFEILLEQNCSDILLFYLCAMYAPICTVEFQPDAIPPCKGVCESARDGCEPIMNEHNVSWPEPLDCNILPRYDRGVCVSPEAIIPSMSDKNIPIPSRGPKQEHIDKTQPKKDCDCPNTVDPSKKVYRKGKYHYAIRARITSIQQRNNMQTLINVTANKVLKSGTVPIREGSNVVLWSDTACICPPVSKKKEYLIIGYEDGSSNRLLHLPKSLVAKWRDKWENSFKKWNKKKNRRGKRKDKGKSRDKKNRDKKNDENQKAKKPKRDRSSRSKERKKQRGAKKSRTKTDI